MSRFLLQMAGESGSGKSTLAHAIGQATGAAVIDKDILKSRILTGDDDMDGLPEETAAPLAYAVLWDIVDTLLAQGFSVVIDGPAFFPGIRAKGSALAAAHGAAYHIVECGLTDVDLLQQRIDAKQLMASQPSAAGVSGYERLGTAVLTEEHLTLDTRLSLDSCLQQALARIGHDQG